MSGLCRCIRMTGLMQSGTTNSSHLIKRIPHSYQTLIHKRNAQRQILPLIWQEDLSFIERLQVPDHFRHVYPEFLPDPKPEHRNKLREKIEREDMLSRRAAVDIPEFYTGSIVAVTISDTNASGKTNRFVGICILKGGAGLRAWFILRNIVDNLGVELLYESYCPLIRSIEVLRLEKRLDEDLTYLRDCLPEFSYIPFDMDAEPLPDGAAVPVNPIKAVLKPRPWHERWERKELKGVEMVRLPVAKIIKAKEHETPWEKYDLMREYRATISEEEQALIYKEMLPHMPRLEVARRKTIKVRAHRDKKGN